MYVCFNPIANQISPGGTINIELRYSLEQPPDVSRKCLPFLYFVLYIPLCQQEFLLQQINKGISYLNLLVAAFGDIQPNNFFARSCQYINAHFKKGCNSEVDVQDLLWSTWEKLRVRSVCVSAQLM